MVAYILLKGVSLAVCSNADLISNLQRLMRATGLVEIEDFVVGIVSFSPSYTHSGFVRICSICKTSRFFLPGAEEQLSSLESPVDNTWVVSEQCCFSSYCTGSK